MYERMLDKQNEPSFNDLIHYCGESGSLWLEFDKYLENEYSAQKQVRFPYGKHYGWSVKYSRKSKHICDVFAENNAFTVFAKISNDNFRAINENLSDYSKKIYEHKYPCGNGGWINFRVLSRDHLIDIIEIIRTKINPQRSIER
jgi:hypothetical protein